MDFPEPKFKTDTEIEQWRVILTETYTYLCVTSDEIRSALVHSGPRPFTVACRLPWGQDTGTDAPRRCLFSDVLVDLRVAASSDRLAACTWLGQIGGKVHDTRHARR